MAIYILRSFFQITKTKGKKFPLRPKACNQIIIEKKTKQDGTKRNNFTKKESICSQVKQKYN